MPRVRTQRTPLEVWDEAQSRLAPGETEQDRTRFLIGLRRLGQHCTFTETGEPAAILPHVPTLNDPDAKRASEDEWEAGSLFMHETQKTVLPAAKPLENHLKRNPTLTRGD